MTDYATAAEAILAHMHKYPERHFFVSHAQVLHIWGLRPTFTSWTNEHDLRRVEHGDGWKLSLKPTQTQP